MFDKEPSIWFLVMGSTFTLIGFGYLIGLNSNQDGISFTNSLFAAIGSISSFFALLLALAIYSSWKAVRRKEILHSKLFDVFNHVDELSFAMSYYIAHKCSSAKYQDTLNEFFKLKRQCNLLSILYQSGKTPNDYKDIIHLTEILIDMSELILLNKTTPINENEMLLSLKDININDNMKRFLEANFEQVADNDYRFRRDALTGEFRGYTNDAIKDWSEFV
ncbi:hypothetical protein [Vibrio natriegens]|uniref:hypothetical protein n=1 Tax=Vibrio natriegens TaxID=691 RepID=UPI00390B4CA4